MVEAFGGPKGKGKKGPFSIWPEAPGTAEAPTDSDPIEQWQGEDTDDQPRSTTTKRQRRNIREALLNGSFRAWVKMRQEVGILPLIK